jgi:hypothetical protein
MQSLLAVEEKALTATVQQAVVAQAANKAGLQ